MATSETVASADALLKEHYTDDVVQNAVLGEGALFGMVRKYAKFGGKRLPIPLIDGNPQGGSATFATAVANKGNASELAYNVIRYPDYSIADVGREVKIASEFGSDDSWLEVAKVNLDGAINTAARAQAINLYGNGTGIRGRVSAGSNVATTSITLADINQIANFETNMFIQLSATNGGGAVRSGQAQITGINRAQGILYFGAALSSLITGAAASDYIVRSGDYLKVFPGLQSLLLTPANYPTAAGQMTILGVDPFPDVLRRAGCYHDGTSQSVEEALIDGQSKGARDGARITHFFLNNVQYRQMLKSLSSKVVYQHVTDSAQGPNGAVATISFSGIQFMGDYGPIKVFADFNCPSTKCFGVKLDELCLYSARPAPHIFDDNTDQMWLRNNNQDSYEVRVGSYSGFGIRNPGHQITIDLQAAV